MRFDISARTSVPGRAEVLAVLSTELSADLEAQGLEDVAVAFDVREGTLNLETTIEAADAADAFRLARARVLRGLTECVDRMGALEDAEVSQATRWLVTEPAWEVAPVTRLSIAG